MKNNKKIKETFSVATTNSRKTGDDEVQKRRVGLIKPKSDNGRHRKS
jgi:hypothetical protein